MADIIYCVNRAAGPLLIIFAILLISACVYVHFEYTLSYHFTVAESSVWFTLWKCLNYIFSIWITLLIYFNYYNAIAVDPGKPALVKMNRNTYSEANSIDQSQTTVEVGDQARNSTAICQKCKRYKPERAHHCSACGCCILKMDHHCIIHF
jgi:palmitoyltransferase ZDHHC2/15/20